MDSVRCSPTRPCLISGSECETFLDFGKMPIANGFLTADQFEAERFFDLKAGFCPQSRMVQLTELVERERMFHDHYPFFSSTSAAMASHFEELGEEIRDRHLLDTRDPFVVEIGSNDGILLRHFSGQAIRHLGIEPSANVARAARDKGIRTTEKFFDEQLAEQIIAQDGQADVVVGCNVMCHIPYLHSVVAGIKKLLKPSGVLIFEDPYIGAIVDETAYDQFYDEHAFYFSAASVSYAFGQHHLDLIDVQPQEVHGGSMRYTLAHRGAYKVSFAVKDQEAREQALALDQSQTYHLFRKRVERSRDELMGLLEGLKRQGKRIVGYGATSKSTTVTNFCGITSDLVEFISDTTPAKHGKFNPGTHIPVRPHEEFERDYPDYALLFAWNHAKEIMGKEARFREAGGKFIVYVPRVQVIP